MEQDSLMEGKAHLGQPRYNHELDNRRKWNKGRTMQGLNCMIGSRVEALDSASITIIAENVE